MVLAIANPIAPRDWYKKKHKIKYNKKVGIEANTGNSTLSLEKKIWLQILANMYPGKDKE